MLWYYLIERWLDIVYSTFNMFPFLLILILPLCHYGQKNNIVDLIGKGLGKDRRERMHG